MRVFIVSHTDIQLLLEPKFPPQYLVGIMNICGIKAILFYFLLYVMKYIPFSCSLQTGQIQQGTFLPASEGLPYQYSKPLSKNSKIQNS